MAKENNISDGTKALLQPVRQASNHVGKGHNILYGRVINIALSQNDYLYKQYNVLEIIQFEPVQDRSIVDESGAIQKNYLVAYKFHPAVRTPIINEIVPLYNGPTINVQDINNQFSETFYYGDPVGIYTSIEHNAAPDQNTIQNLNNFNSFHNKISSYQNSNSGLSSNKNGTDTILSSNNIKFGDYFTEKGIKSLAPLEGDFKLEGRFGHSIRFGGTPSSKISSNLSWKGNVGSPIVIIRNNQLKLDPGSNIDALFEDINQDGSSVYMTSDQTIELVLGSDNFDSYGQNNDNSQVNTKVIIPGSTIRPISQSAANSDNISVPMDVLTLPVTQSSLQAVSAPSVSNDLQFVPDNEDDLQFVQIGEDIPVPLTQGVFLNSYNKNYKFVTSVNGSSRSDTTLNSAPTINISSVNAISKYAGQVSSVPSITKNGKALLDLLALTEGTIGQGNYNGYDIMVTGKLVPGYTAPNATPPHPNIKIFVPEYNIYSSATGRYQFVISTWNLIMGQKTTVSKFNQDYACWKNILNSANVPSILITKIDTDYSSFQQVINMMASQWASLPVLNDPKGLYKQAGRFSFNVLNTYYQQILSKYQ